MTEGDNQNPHPSPSPDENDLQKNKDVPIDVRAMLGTDAMKARFEKGRRVRWRLAISIAIFAGIAVMVVILLPLGNSNEPAREGVEQETFMVSGSLDILADLEKRFHRKHGRYASESELAAAYPVVEMHIKSIEANDYRLEFQVSAKSFRIAARPAKPDKRKRSFRVTSAD
ncbi:MAG: hypothetical protein E3J72_12425 [Planctomycetota bacterium]|nr:MAG: hypothetical protein E3J72_12425 [Planctomycetota bacterium]